MPDVYDLQKASSTLCMCKKDFRIKLIYRGHIQPLPRSSPRGKLRFMAEDVERVVGMIKRREIVL